MSAPIVLHLYDPDTEECTLTLEKNVIPWGLLKKAMKLADIQNETIDDSTFDKISGFICEVYAGKVTTKQLDEGADMAEMFAVLMGVISRAKQFFPNGDAGK